MGFGGSVPVIGAVHVNVPVPPFAILAMHADGVGPVKAPIVAVPKGVNGDGLTLFTAAPVLFVTVMVKVAVSPEKTHVGLATMGPLTAIPIVKRLTVRILEFALLDVTVAILWAIRFTNWIVPLSVPAVEYWNVIVPDARAARFKGFGL